MSDDRHLRLFTPAVVDEELFEELPVDPVSESQARSSRHGRQFDIEAFEWLEAAGATIVEEYPVVLGYRLDALIEGRNGARFYVDAHGTPDRTDRPNAGLRRTDTMLKAGFKALRLHQRRCEHPLLLVTSHLPRGGKAAFFLVELSDAIFDAFAIGDPLGLERLRSYLNDAPAPVEPGYCPWRAVQPSLLDDPFGDDDAVGGEDAVGGDDGVGGDDA
jgi:hypothetical protein